MSDVSEGTAVYESGGVLQGLNQIGLQSILQQSSHSTLSLQVASSNGLAVEGVSHHQASQTVLEVGNVRSQAQNSHDFGSNGDIVAILTGHTVDLAAQAVVDEAELTVVHIDAAAPGDLTGVDVQSIALINMVIQHGSQQVVGSADCVEVTGEVQVDVLHGDNLSITTAGSAALHTKHRSQRRLTQSNQNILADSAHTVSQANSGCGLALTGGGGVDSGHENQLAVGAIGFVQDVVVNLSLVLAVLLQVLLIHTGGLSNLSNGLHGGFLCDFNVGFESHVHQSPCIIVGTLPLEWLRPIQDV